MMTYQLGSTPDIVAAYLGPNSTCFVSDLTTLFLNCLAEK
jgi:hypothetical protein